MINVLFEPFPECIFADGQEYRILTDFREWLRFEEMLRDPDISAEERAYFLGMWIDPEPDRITAGMVDGLLRFLRAEGLDPDPPEQDDDEDEEPQQPVPKPPVLDFCIDAAYILGDFRRFYGIDLRSVKYLHWWEYLALLRALPDDSSTMRRAGYRSVNLNDIPDKHQRARIARIQRQIALPFEFDDEMIGAALWNMQ